MVTTVMESWVCHSVPVQIRHDLDLRGWYVLSEDSHQPASFRLSLSLVGQTTQVPFSVDRSHFSGSSSLLKTFLLLWTSPVGRYVAFMFILLVPVAPLRTIAKVCNLLIAESSSLASATASTRSPASSAAAIAAVSSSIFPSLLLSSRASFVDFVE